ncbi:MAG TPA: ankyrin repeat domain-containing protein, partial [Steroidobacteraceae bacterium]|nr:ankyrin repeat domain-containing protein [Steroidobacteraceae bacterium]
NLLVSRGQKIDERTPDGLTALHLAVRNARQETAKFLVRHGADLDAKNAAGVSALELVERNGDARFVAMLKSAAAPTAAAGETP